MFPIRDHNPSERTPYVTYGLIALNIAIFVIGWPLLSDARGLFEFYQNWALVPAKASSAGSAYNFVTSTFLHGGVMHLAGNMLFLWVFGDNMEDRFGPVWFLLFYLTCGVGAGLIHVINAPTSEIPLVGASGAIAGVLGGYLLLFPKARVDILFIFIIFFKIIPVPAWLMLGVWFGLQLLNSSIGASTGDGVAYWAHTGGFIFGVLLTLPYWVRNRAGHRAQGNGPSVSQEPESLNQNSDIPSVRRRRK